MQVSNEHILISPEQQEFLLEGLRSSKQQAFTQLYHYLQPRVYWFARKFVEEKADAEDFTAEAFIQLWKRRGEFESMDAVSAFLHVTVRNKCYDYLRHLQVKANRHTELLYLLEQQDTDTFHTEQVRLEVLKRIYAEVDKLPGRMKEVFLLSYAEGLKPAQIAERLNLKVQTVTNTRVTAIRVLQSALSRDPLAIALLVLMEIQAQGASWPGA